MALAQDIGHLMSAEVVFERYSNGVPGGVLTSAINVPEFTYSPGDPERFERKSYKRDTFGQVLDEAVTPGTPTVSITTDTINSEIGAYLFLGTESSMDQDATPVTDEAITVTELDKGYKLAKYDVGSVVVQDDTDTTTYTLGTDYTLDAESGIIYILSGGAISVDDVVHVDYTPVAHSGSKIDLSTEDSILTKLHVYGKDRASGKIKHFILSKVRLSPSGDVPVLGGDGFASFQLSGTVQTPTGDTSPGYFLREV